MSTPAPSQSSSTRTPRAALWVRLLALWQEVRSRVELRLLLGVLLIALGMWLFIEIADEVLEGETVRFDEAILLSLRNPADRTDPLGPPWVEEMGRDFTALGGTAIVTLVTVGVCLYFALARRWALLWLIVIVVGGASVFNLLLKSGFDRPRPDLVPHGMTVYQASFPSGHAMLSASVYLTLGALLARIQTRRFQALLVMGTAILVTLLVGISRVYLAVHWPSDVVAGWVAGSIWATLCSLVGWQFQKYRGRRFRRAQLHHESHPDHPAVRTPAPPNPQQTKRDAPQDAEYAEPHVEQHAE